MTRVELSKLARRQLNRIAQSRESPGVVFANAAEGVAQLADHPESGQLVSEFYEGYRILVVGRPALLLLYWYDEPVDLVSVTAILDARGRGAPRP